MAGMVCLLGATPSLAANLVQVRVGNHPTVSRVVFELDAPAGYRIENAVDQNVKELIVTLEAASTPRSVTSKSPEVGLVSVQDGTAATVAHIRLRRGVAGVKELILTNPPRIVIDLMREPSLIATQKASAVAPTTAEASPAVAPAPPKAPEARPAEPAAAPKPVAKPVETPIAPKPVAAPVEVPVAPKPVAKAVEAPVTPEPEARPAPIPVIPKLEPPKPEPKLAQAPDTPRPDAQPAAAPPNPTPDPLALAPVPEPDSEPVEPGPSATAEAAPPVAPMPAPTPVAKPPAPSSAETAQAGSAARASGESPLGFETKQIAALAGGVLLLVILVVLLLRRRSLPNDLDVTALVDEDDEDLGPAAPITQGLDFGAGERATEPMPHHQAPMAPTAPATPPSGLFADTDQELFDTSEKGEKKMSQDTLDLPTSRGARPVATQATATSAASAGDSDVGRLLRELERRVAQLETRLDESNDAREKLERQVAAQSEELRVQRAAIARTQRALRGLNRGEDEQATEPALRDPNRPMGGN
jgi:hypothetical protein